jgi:hypothetical protein
MWQYRLVSNNLHSSVIADLKAEYFWGLNMAYRGPVSILSCKNEKHVSLKSGTSRHVSPLTSGEVELRAK